jgi:CheY-like chemotaxis protein
MEIVLRHARHNPYRFELAPRSLDESLCDIALVDMTVSDGRDAARALQTLARRRRLVKIGRRLDASRGCDDLMIGSFTLDLLKVLNRAVEPSSSVRWTLAPAAPGGGLAAAGHRESPRAVHEALAGRGQWVRTHSAHAASFGGAPGGLMAIPGYLHQAQGHPTSAVRLPAAHRVSTLGAVGAAKLAQRALTPAKSFLDTAIGLIRNWSVLPTAGSSHAVTAHRREPTLSPLSLPLPVRARSASLQGGSEALTPVRGTASSGTALAAEPTPPRALLVDDSPTVRHQMVLALRRLGVECDALASAEEGWRRLHAQRYDLVFVDLNLPGADGLQFTRAIRLVPAWRRLPVTVLTRRDGALDMARAALAGCTSYLVKPITLKTLTQTVSTQLKARKPMPTAARLPAPAPTRH